MKTKFLTLLAIPVIGLSSLASGQTEADITTSASVVGPNLWSISQTGTANISGTGDVNFTFDRFESVANGLLAGQTLQAVIVRITHSWGSTSVFVTNDGTENYVGGANERARITFAFDTFTLGARTGQDAEFAAISAGDFTVDSPVVNLPIAGQTITPGQTITANNPGGERTVERNVAEGFFVDYSSTGQFSFSFDSEFDFSSNIAGENMDFGGTFTNSIMEVTIEYVAIPEPGTIAAGLLSLGFIGFTVFRRVRRQKKD